MFDYQPNENFEPSSHTKQWYLYTHKTEYSFSGVPLPGLFQTTHYEWQVAGFLAIFLLEGIATFWASREGVVITAILVSIFVDLVLAVGAHRFQRSVCKLRNELVFEQDKEASLIRRQIKRTLAKQRLCYLMIAVSGVLKFVWFFDAYRIFDATALFVFTCYAIGAMLHMSCTGYALFTFILERKLYREHARYVETRGEAFAYGTDPLPHPLGEHQFVPLRVGKHEIKSDGNGKFWLYTFGVLTDAELRELIAKQYTPEQRRLLAIEGTSHQAMILTQGDAEGSQV